jgi:AcrR family transcriptional regulator
MPFTRFEKLTQERRERVLDAAAQEFAAYGFEDSSINRILENANMSKGAAYYYFEDKAEQTAFERNFTDGFADPATQVGYGYVTNKQWTGMLDDPREKSLRDAFYRIIM